MSDECLHFCKDELLFPKRPANRPALERIDYRIGAYAEFRAAMLRRLHLQPVLLNWTHREPDDPGIALLEGAAILGDILTFYQDLYANEAWLRTAQWRESVAELVRLLGYRLSPGLGGRGAFAFEVKGTQAVTVPAGFGVQVDLEGSTQPAQFETGAELIAHPHLSRFNFYRPRTYGSFILQGITSALELAATAASPAVELKPGDRLMLMPSENMWSVSGTTFTPQSAPQIIKLTKITHILDRTILEFEGRLAHSWVAPVTAYRVGRSFHHFGHNAPPQSVTNETDSSGTITGATQTDTSFDRHLYHDCWKTSLNGRSLPADSIPLDQEVNDILVGAALVIQALVEVGSPPVKRALTVVRTIASLEKATLNFGNLGGTSTFVQFTADIVTNSNIGGKHTTDVRSFQIHEVTSPPLTLNRLASFSSGAQTAASLQFFGTHAEVKPLAGRRLLLQHQDGRVIELTCTDAATVFPAPVGADYAKMWTVHFDKAPSVFLKQAFDEATPRVTVFGNVTDASQGKTQREAALGNGDNRQTFQTFKLPKAPLTYVPAPGGTPPEAPELEIRVNGILWKRVDSFFGRGPKEEIYIAREDAKGDSFVQFGDSETGARLPSGVNNVTAHFRAGSGARGKLKPEAKPQAGGRLDGLEKIHLPDIISGGSHPETADKARDAAPGKIQSLGRLVSLRDFETETLGIAGVTKVAAAWALDSGVPSVVLIVLLAAGRAKSYPGRSPLRVSRRTVRVRPAPATRDGGRSDSRGAGRGQR